MLQQEQILINALTDPNRFASTTYLHSINTTGTISYEGGQYFISELAPEYNLFTQVWDGYSNVAIGPFNQGSSSSGQLIFNAISGGSGHDILWDNTQSGTLRGYEGNDILISGPGGSNVAGNAYLDGGEGNDLLVVGMQPTGQLAGQSFFEGWYTSLGQVTPDMTDEQVYDKFIHYGDYPPHNLGHSLLEGGSGADTLMSGGAADSLHGGYGNDLLLGGGNNDMLYGDSRYENEQDLPTQGNNNDTIFGGTGYDVISGEVGDDYLDGEQDADSLFGGDGNDTMLGGEGADILWGENGNDLMDGGIGVDTLRGGAGQDTLWGGEGNDFLMGEDGNDFMIGGAGGDEFKGGTGLDTASYQSSTSGVVASLTTGIEQSGDAAGDTFAEVEALSGSYFDDTLFGDANNNILTGNAGYDFIAGGAGDDMYLFGIDSDYDHIVEAAGGGTDNLYLVGVTEIGVFKQGNHLLFAANDYDVIVLEDWYVNQGVEYIDFEALGFRYNVSDFANLATEISANNSMYMATNDQGFITTDITALGINPIGGFTAMDTGLVA